MRQRIHKYVKIYKEIEALWVHNLGLKINNPKLLLVPIFNNYIKLLSYTIRIKSNEPDNLYMMKNISSISECDMDFIRNTIYIKSMGQRVKLDENNLIEFGKSAGFEDLEEFWAFYEEMYRDIIVEDDNFTLELLIIYCV